MATSMKGDGLIIILIIKESILMRMVKLKNQIKHGIVIKAKKGSLLTLMMINRSMRVATSTTKDMVKAS